MSSEQFIRPSILNLNRKILVKKIKDHILQMDISSEEKLITYEDFMEKIDLYLQMEEQERISI